MPIAVLAFLAACKRNRRMRGTGPYGEMDGCLARFYGGSWPYAEK
jgi:hypothetical protein